MFFLVLALYVFAIWSCCAFHCNITRDFPFDWIVFASVSYNLRASHSPTILKDSYSQLLVSRHKYNHWNARPPLLTTWQGRNSLPCSLISTIRLFLHAAHASQSRDTIMIKSPDSDVVIIFIAFSSKLKGNTFSWPALKTENAYWTSAKSLQMQALMLPRRSFDYMSVQVVTQPVVGKLLHKSNEIASLNITLKK